MTNQVDAKREAQPDWMREMDIRQAILKFERERSENPEALNELVHFWTTDTDALVNAARLEEHYRTCRSVLEREVGRSDDDSLFDKCGGPEGYRCPRAQELEKAQEAGGAR